MDAINNRDTLPLRQLLTPGQALLIEGVSANGEEYERWGQYQSRIQKVQDGSLMVSSPRRRGTMVRFHDGTDVMVYFTRHGIRLCFQAIVCNPADSTPLVTHLMAISELRKHDRREHVRVELVAQPTGFSVESYDNKSSRSLAPILTDISIGGMRISCLRELPLGTRIHIILDLPEFFGRIEAVVEVRAVFPPRDNVSRRWHMGLKFVGMGASDMDKIAGFVQNQQERMKKVGIFTNLTGAPPDDISSAPPTGRG